MKETLKNKKNKKLKIFIITLVSIISISLLIVINNRTKPVEKTNKLPYEITSPIELLEYYKCSDVIITKSNEKIFEKDIYLKFAEDLWVDGKSNEAYFKAINLYLTDLFNYESYRLIDDDRELVIAVICNSEKKKIEKIYINGESNYFEKNQTKKVIENYSKTPNTNIQVQSKEIQKYIKNNWNTKGILIGTLESRYNGYDIYFDEGIEVKTLGGKVYNIVFTEKYKDDIVNNLKVNDKKDKIVQTLGKPTFENEDVFGYKSNEIYVFFSENQVSVYRVENEYNNKEFEKIFTEFQENKDAKKFLNDITNLWSDNNIYIYDSNMIYLEYALKGLCIQFNVSTENGIILYNNFEGQILNEVTLENLNINNLPMHVYIKDKDLVFEKEIERVNSNIMNSSEEYINMVDENYFLEVENEKFCFNNKESDLFYLRYQYVPNKGIREVKFISKNNAYPNSELIRHIQIYTYGWIDNEQFIYSVLEEGIFSYNAKTRELKTIVKGNEDYKIKEIKENTLFYDDTNIKIK